MLLHSGFPVLSLNASSGAVVLLDSVDENHEDALSRLFTDFWSADKVLIHRLQEPS